MTTVKDFNAKLETITNDWGQVRAYVYDDGTYRVIGQENTDYGHKWQVNVINKQVKTGRCYATRVNKANVVRMMLKYYEWAKAE